jgi:N-acetylglutamate synthase
MSDLELLRRTEIATVLGWKPLAQIVFDDWIVSANGGAIGRLNSTAILGPGQGQPALEKIAQAEDFFAAHQTAPAFRIIFPLVSAETLLALAARGYGDDDEKVLVMVRDAAGVPAPAWPVTTLPNPDDPWRDVFGGDGFDAVDSKLRAQTYARTSGVRFFTSWIGECPAGAGITARHHDMVGIHAMRTKPAHRGAGHASAIIAAMAADAGKSATLFLHVAAENAPAISVYRKLGFREIGAYHYWRKR